MCKKNFFPARIKSPVPTNFYAQCWMRARYPIGPPASALRPRVGASIPIPLAGSNAAPLAARCALLSRPAEKKSAPSYFFLVPPSPSRNSFCDPTGGAAVFTMNPFGRLNRERPPVMCLSWLCTPSGRKKVKVTFLRFLAFFDFRALIPGLAAHRAWPVAAAPRCSVDKGGFHGAPLRLGSQLRCQL